VSGVAGSGLAPVLDDLGRRGFEEAEVFAKRGRSRRLRLDPFTRASELHEERGWAVRAGTARASLFAAGTGEPPPDGPWPEPDGRPIRLPPPVEEGGAGAGWSEPADFEAPLVGEGEGLEVLAAIGRELAEELAGARLLSVVLEDGASESELASRRGVTAGWRGRVAVLRVEAALGGGAGAGPAVAVELAEREARRFEPRALARRVADRLAAEAAGPPGGFAGRDRGELVLAPALGARLLAALVPLVVGPGAAERIGRLRDRRGRVAGDAVTVVDDGRLPGGVLTAPVDGEGLPTRRVTLIEEGRFRQALVAWDEARVREARPAGCRRRAGWRDLPATAPSHLYLAAGEAPPGELVAELARGYYLLDATGPPAVDLADGRFAVPVCGFAVERGRASAPVAGVTLAGTLQALLHGIQAAGRDLAFFPYDGMVGSPTLRVSGLELRGPSR